MYSSSNVHYPSLALFKRFCVVERYKRASESEPPGFRAMTNAVRRPSADMATFLIGPMCG